MTFDAFVPTAQLVTNVTNGVNAVVTTASNHNFNVGDAVRLIVPVAYGMIVTYLQVIVLAITPTTITTNLDTSQLQPFVTPTFPPAFTSAQVTPITGLEQNLGLL